MEFSHGSSDRTVKGWDAETGQEVITLQGHTDGVTCVAFSPDGKRIVSGRVDNTVKVFEPDRILAKQRGK